MANGGNGTGKAPSPNGRDPETGKFVKGHRGGPGNPFGAQVERLRAALLKAITPKKVGYIADRLLGMALDGEGPDRRFAIAEILDRTIGKAKQTVNLEGVEPYGDPFAVFNDPGVSRAIDQALARRTQSLQVDLSGSDSP